MKQHFLSASLIVRSSLQERQAAEFLHVLESNTCHEPSSQTPSEISSQRTFNPGISNPPVKAKAESWGSWHSVSSSHRALGRAVLLRWTVWQPAGLQEFNAAVHLVILKAKGKGSSPKKHRGQETVCQGLLCGVFHLDGKTYCHSGKMNTL